MSTVPGQPVPGQPVPGQPVVIQTVPAHPVPQAAGLSTADTEPRATFGWRPGTIRGLLSLMVLLLLWSVALFSPDWARNQQIPLVYIYLQYLLVLIVAYYFPPYGSISRVSRTDRRLVRLWPEVVPWVLAVGSLGLIIWVWRTERTYLFPAETSFTAPLVVLAGFFVGHALTWLFSRFAGGVLPAWFQDLQAWVALLGIIGMAAELLIHLFVLQTIDPDQQASWRGQLARWEGLLAAVVAFYYGARTESPRVSS